MYLVFSILGVIGGLLCCVGDCFLDLKGADNEKRGTSGQIDTNWLKMAEWRFGVSTIFAMFGVIGAGLGYFSLTKLIYEASPTLGTVAGIMALSGISGSLFIHAFLCVQAVIYKRIMADGEQNFEIADRTLEGMYKTIIIPFFVLYFTLLAFQVCVIIAIFSGALSVPKWMALLNSIIFMVIGLSLRKLFPKKFYDLPGIIMPSFGISMMGLIGIVALL